MAFSASPISDRLEFLVEIELSVLLRRLVHVLAVLILDVLLKFPPLLSVNTLEDLRRPSLSNVNVLCELRVKVKRPASKPV